MTFHRSKQSPENVQLFLETTKTFQIFIFLWRYTEWEVYISSELTLSKLLTFNIRFPRNPVSLILWKFCFWFKEIHTFFSFESVSFSNLNFSKLVQVLMYWALICLANTSPKHYVLSRKRFCILRIGVFDSARVFIFGGTTLKGS